MSQWLSDGLEELKKAQRLEELKKEEAEREEAEREEKKFVIPPWPAVPAEWPRRKMWRPSRSEPPSLKIPSRKPNRRRRTVALAMVMMAGEFYVT